MSGFSSTTWLWLSVLSATAFIGLTILMPRNAGLKGLISVGILFLLSLILAFMSKSKMGEEVIIYSGR